MITNKHISQVLKELREERGWSQEQLAKSMGVSRVAISDIENNKRSVSALELIKASEVFNVPVNFLLDEEQPFQPIKRPVQKDVVFASEKLKNTILYLLTLCGGKPNLGETVLYKLLYFIDFNFYEKAGKSVTGLSYVKLQFGPVPVAKEYNPTIQRMVLDGTLKIFNQSYYGNSQKRYIALENPDLQIFSGLELNMIARVVEQLSDMSAFQIKEYVHKDVPWQVSQMKEIIPYTLVFERTYPYAQVDWGQAFQNAGAKDILKDLGPISRDEADYYENL